MKKGQTIKLKAALLLLVFSLNTLIASALGLKMEYNEHHHEAEIAAPTSNTDRPERGSDLTSHLHKKQHHPKNENSKDDWCNSGLISSNLFCKTISQQVEIVPQVISTSVSIAWVMTNTLFLYTNVAKGVKLFVRSHHPPIPDIHIAIHSFQI